MFILARKNMYILVYVRLYVFCTRLYKNTDDDVVFPSFRLP